jgi:hypothetical protein
MSALDTDLLARLIRGRLDCLARLRDMGTKQLELVEANQTTELLDVLAVKQRVLLELQGIERQLAPFRDQRPDERRWRTREDRQECARQLERCEALLRDIVTQEKQSERALTRRRDDLAAQLHGMHVASQARGAYTAQSRPDVRRIDLTSER